ncbi:MAG: GNAT family N-acetyltransferase [Clostridia bacterium]|nr:GNAT family N-acetyltransferase [Clostridia bacterium]
MLKFTAFSEKHLKKIQGYTANSPYRVCDLTAGVLLMWNDVFNVSFAEYDDTLILKCCFKNKFTVFFLPIGKNVLGALGEIERYTVEKCLPLKFMCIEEENLPFLKERYGEISFEYDRDFSDYLYDYEKLTNLVGKKFSGQRNHINSFNKLYPSAKFKPLLTRDIPRVKEFLKEYKKEHRGGGKIERHEFLNTIKLIDNLKKANFVGGFMEVDGKMVSFTIGEYAGKTFVIHVEKALRNYKGVYPTTFNSFLKLCKKDGVIYINREDDSGDLGLRTSKLQYQPEMLLNKHFVEVKKPMKIKSPPTLKGERVVLSKITSGDKEFYHKLYTAKTLNRYWGYDYKKDIKNPTADAFFNLQKNDFKNKNNLCLLIREKSLKTPIGEIVFHNFSYDKKVEIGVRLLKKYHGKGYAKESLQLAISYAVNKLKLTPVAKCYHQNKSSLFALQSAGFVENFNDNKYCHLIYKK